MGRSAWHTVGTHFKRRHFLSPPTQVTTPAPHRHPGRPARPAPPDLMHVETEPRGRRNSEPGILALGRTVPPEAWRASLGQAFPPTGPSFTCNPVSWLAYGAVW